MELPLHLGVGKLKAYLGLNPVKNNNQYNRRLRRHLQAIAYNTLINYYRRKKDEAEEFINIVKNASSRGEAMLRIQLIILRILRKAWIEAENNQTNKGLAG
jgi:DNA-directed RNA polymerase specialized sigma24 family protein